MLQKRPMMNSSKGVVTLEEELLLKNVLGLVLGEVISVADSRRFLPVCSQMPDDGMELDTTEMFTDFETLTAKFHFTGSV
ncbi:hypothetical protein LSAT2_029605 [Lamellibrachia satsuma]|nr:hypothetical protein LSAT2_029605 [Lamellibrachia satsuma]